MTQKISIVLPAYNEERNISSTIASIADFFIAKQCPYEIIVVDDGSTDGTAEIIKELTKKFPEVRALTHTRNQGKGAAVRSGMNAACGDIVFFLDADGSTPIHEIEKLLPFFDTHQVVIGSRYLQDSSITIRQPRYRVAMGRFGNTLIQRVLLPGIKDTQCGCKGFRLHAAREIFSRQTITGWGFDMEILALAQVLGYAIKEVAVSWHDTRNRMSRFRPFKDAIKTLHELLTIKINLARGHYHLPPKEDL
ncbi:glycosyltransferase family 2 protein [Candidatus Uhrbacteria bacterium]|nr:glycosyltransferase family 2 protein [Candidatus Uhrbacteria bacterium]